MTNTPHVPALGIRLLVLLMMVGQSTLADGQAPGSPDTACERDYPIPTRAVDYEKAFSSETLAPDTVSVNRKILRLGGTQESVAGVLGATPRVVENWEYRNAQQQCEYLLGLLSVQPNSMHLYRIKSLQSQKMSGAFRASVWQLPGIGTFRAFFYKSPSSTMEVSYLYYLTPLPVSANNIERSKGSGYVLTRKGVPSMKWDVRTNSISISSE